MMNSLKLNEDSCRICLLQKGKLNWNEEILLFSGISYKDCYYKYTQLEEFDSDCYPTNLCKMCANELKTAHILFEKALESVNILRSILRTKELENLNSSVDSCYSQPVVELENHAFDEDNSQIDDKTMTVIKDQYDSEGLELTDNINDCEEEIMRENETVEPAHFIDIQKLEIEQCNIELPESKVFKNSRKRKKYDIISDTSLEQLSESFNSKLSNASTTKRAGKSKKKIKECYNTELAKQSSLEQNLSEGCETKSVLQNTNPRDKYYLMCSYCSLKVRGAVKLASHEATHVENRKRTATCPHCGVQLYDKMGLKEHLKIHDGNRQKNHKCEFCESAFYNRGSLNVHRRIHLGQMSKCQICKKEFFRQIDLDRHLVKHSASPLQRNIGQKKYVVQCEYCNESLRTVSYKAHVAAHLNQPQVKCKICDKNFFSRISATKHLRRVHHKNSTEYENCIHYYDDKKSRLSNLMMKQQLSVQLITKDL